MTPEDMIINNVTIQIFESASKAPHYDKSTKMLQVKKCLIVNDGTVNGNPTVDLQMEDAAGNKYLVLATGGIVEMLGAAVQGVREKAELARSTKH